MNYYEVLGVARTATAGEMRRAYLDLARRHHPDRANSAGADADRMREVNGAWAVLGDPARRVAYDREIVDGRRRTAGGAAGHPADPGRPGRSFVRSPGPNLRPENATSPGWRPLDGDDDDDIADLAELLDDTPVPGTEVPRWMQVVPTYLLGLAVIALAIGLIASLPEVVALGIGAFALSVLSFAAVPVFAIFTSRSHDLDP